MNKSKEKKQKKTSAKPKKIKESTARIAARERYNIALAAASSNLCNETIRKMNKALAELESTK